MKELKSFFQIGGLQRILYRRKRMSIPGEDEPVELYTKFRAVVKT